MVDDNSTTTTSRDVRQRTRRSNSEQPQDNSCIRTNCHSPGSSSAPSLNNRNDGSRSEPFCQNVSLLMTNIKIVRSHTAGVLFHRPFNPNSSLISLKSLIRDGARHGKNIIVIILSISLASANSQIQVQQRFNGTRGHVNHTRHDRKIVVMCPFSPPGSNTAIILLGSAGSSDRFFDGDISLRDNGAIRK